MNLVQVVLKASPKALTSLLKEKGYKRTGECFHPAWNNTYKGEILSKPMSPMFWIFNSGLGNQNEFFIWIHVAVSAVSKAGESMIVGNETQPIPQKTAKGIIQNLCQLLGDAHLQYSYDDSSKNLDGWTGWNRHWKGKKLTIEIT